MSGSKNWQSRYQHWDYFSWTDEDRHFVETTRQGLKTIKYHGQNRYSTPGSLAEADIVVTTYHTLASDFTGNRKLLRELEWYRLVLDEGI